MEKAVESRWICGRGVAVVGKRKRKTTKRRLVYLKHKLRPADLLHFIELKPFQSAWDDKFGDKSDAVLEYLQVLIMCAPKIAPVISGTQGLRKLRFTPPDSNKGKSGAYRACYVYFERLFTVLLVIVYPKSESDDIPKHLLGRINTAILEIEAELERRHER